VSARKKHSLRDTWQHIRTVPGLRRDVIALTVMIAAAATSVIIVNSFVSTKGFFQDTVTYHAEFENVAGLNPNATPHFVSIAGVRVGDVSGWRPTNRGTAIVDLEMTPPFGMIYDNATVVLRPKNPLNDMSITISPGGPPGQPLKPDALIPVSQTKRPIQINEALGHLDERTQSAVSDLMNTADVALANAPKQLPSGINATNATLATFRPVMQQLQQRRDNIAKLVTALSQIATGLGGDHQRAVQLANSVQTTLKVLADNQNNLTATLDQFPGLSHQLRSALSATQDLTKELNPSLDNLSRASDELPKALDHFGDTVDQLDDVVDAARPFVRVARPVIDDLQPVIEDTHDALDEIRPVTARLDRDTDVVGTYLTMIQAFTANTTSIFGFHDGNGGSIRGFAPVAKYPDGTSFFPGAMPGYSPRPADAGTGPGLPSGATPMPWYVPGGDDYNPGYNERHGSHTVATGGHK
jgi:phospholipid/cholesterol/gamma-HCH transport system substrate-binding protein